MSNSSSPFNQSIITNSSVFQPSSLVIPYPSGVNAILREPWPIGAQPEIFSAGLVVDSSRRLPDHGPAVVDGPQFLYSDVIQKSYPPIAFEKPNQDIVAPAPMILESNFAIDQSQVVYSDGTPLGFVPSKEGAFIKNYENMLANAKRMEMAGDTLGAIRGAQHAIDYLQTYLPQQYSALVQQGIIPPTPLRGLEAPENKVERNLQLNERVVNEQGDDEKIDSIHSVSGVQLAGAEAIEERVIKKEHNEKLAIQVAKKSQRERKAELESRGVISVRKIRGKEEWAVRKNGVLIGNYPSKNEAEDKKTMLRIEERSG